MFKQAKVVEPKETKITVERLCDRDFVKLWLTSDTTEIVASSMGVSIGSASQRAAHLRVKGVNLPKKNKRDYNSVTELNKLIEKYGN